jgi:hypothetical protein
MASPAWAANRTWRATPKSRLLVSLCLTIVGVAITALMADVLPPSLSDREFWTTVSDYSEPSESFNSENLISNETSFQRIVPNLAVADKPGGGVYLGVGSEQNFTYIAAVRPAMAFIVDIRRGNLTLHLMYKALFELSTDRADFVSRLFARPRPDSLTRESSVEAIFKAFSAVEPSEALYRRNLRSIEDHLAVTHGFVLSDGDRQVLTDTYRTFYTFGPEIRYSSKPGAEVPASSGRGRIVIPREPTFAALMTATDSSGQARAFLATEERFKFVKELQVKNLVIPLVGDFAGPRTLRTLGGYLRSHDARVLAFYVSNVEDYLKVARTWRDFCQNVATLPLDPTSVFIRVVGRALTMQLGNIAADIQSCQ